VGPVAATEVDAAAGYEYTTLACNWSAPVTKTTAAVMTSAHLRAAFFDQPTDDRCTVLLYYLRVRRAISGPVESVYKGSIRWDDVVENSVSGDCVDRVNKWLLHVGAALIGRVSEEPVVYEYFL